MRSANICSSFFWNAIISAKNIGLFCDLFCVLQIFAGLPNGPDGPSNGPDGPSNGPDNPSNGPDGPPNGSDGPPNGPDGPDGPPNGPDGGAGDRRLRPG